MQGWLASCDIPAGCVVYSTTPGTRLRVIDLALATKVGLGMISPHDLTRPWPAP